MFARHDCHLEPCLGEPAHDRALAAVVEDDEPRAGADRERLLHHHPERQLGCRRFTLLVPRDVDVRLRARERDELVDGRLAERAAHRAVLAHAAHERASVDLLERNNALVGEPVLEGRARRMTTPRVCTAADSMRAGSTP